MVPGAGCAAKPPVLPQHRPLLAVERQTPPRTGKPNHAGGTGGPADRRRGRRGREQPAPRSPGSDGLKREGKAEPGCAPGQAGRLRRRRAGHRQYVCSAGRAVRASAAGGSAAGLFKSRRERASGISRHCREPAAISPRLRRPGWPWAMNHGPGGGHRGRGGGEPPLLFLHRWEAALPRSPA